MQISDSIKDLYRRLIAIQRYTATPNEDEPKIEVDDIVSRLSYIYEKMRNTMDYKEDHLLRRFAIERNIRRRVVLETLQPKVAESLIEELIRSGYLPNNAVPESLIPVVATIIEKYVYLIELVHENLSQNFDRRGIINWITGIMACEIDLVLVPELKVDALIETLYGIVHDRIKLQGGNLSEREKNIQLYITLHKELVKSDNPIISFHLFNLYFPEWSQADKRLVEFVADKIGSIYAGIKGHLDNPVRKKMAQSLKRQIVAFKILRELINRHQDDLSELFAEPETLELEARKVINQYYHNIRRRLRTSSVRAIAYIFITKVALAFVLEYPYELYLVGKVNTLALGINILFPPFLMFLVTLTSRLPGLNNTKIILSDLSTIVYGDAEDNILCNLRVGHQRGKIYHFFEYVFYVLLYALIFGLIIAGLRQLNFNILSGGLFIFFVTLVSFFGTRIRQLTKEYSVEKKREGLLSFMINFFSLPIVRAGHWLSINMQRINLFAFIMDFVVEAPFKLVVEMIESWMRLLKEKREDIYKNQ